MRILSRSIACVLVIALVLPVGAFGQGATTDRVFRQEELEQMLAPIALYPDPLLVQMLMAATYPLEVVEAARWVNTNPGLRGEELAAALEQKHWDPSVKSLVSFPNALAMMDGNIEWTRNLGDAFLAQKDQVMDTIQSLRSRAQAEGNLKTTAEQVVTNQDNLIAIEPANPGVVYVPTYDPALVYGEWPYPDYPPYAYYPPGYVIGDAIGSIISFGVGLVLGAAWWGWAWGGFDWYNHRVYCTPYSPYYGPYPGYPVYGGYKRDPRYGQRPYPIPRDRSEWSHDPSHRRSVGYRDARSREKYGQTRPIPDARRKVLGYTPDMRTPGERIGERPGARQDRNALGRDNGAFDRRVATLVHGPSLAEGRQNRVMSGRSGADRPENGALVVERLRTSEREPQRMASQPQQGVAPRPYGATIRYPQEIQGGPHPSTRSYTAHPSNRGLFGVSPPRVERMKAPDEGRLLAVSQQRANEVRPSSYGGGVFPGSGKRVASTVDRRGSSGGAGTWGGFSEKMGGFGGGQAARARGFGG